MSCRPVSHCRPPSPLFHSGPPLLLLHHTTQRWLACVRLQLILASTCQMATKGEGGWPKNKKQRLIFTFPVSVKVFQEAGSAEPWKEGETIISFLSSPSFAPAASLRSNDDLQESRDILYLTWNSTIKTQICSNWRYFLVNTRRLHQNFQHQHPQT